MVCGEVKAIPPFAHLHQVFEPLYKAPLIPESVMIKQSKPGKISTTYTSQNKI